MAIPRQINYAATAGLAVPVACLLLWSVCKAAFPEVAESPPQWLAYIQAAVWPGSVALYDLEFGVFRSHPGRMTLAALLNSLLYLSAAAALHSESRRGAGCFLRRLARFRPRPRRAIQAVGKAVPRPLQHAAIAGFAAPLAFLLLWTALRGALPELAGGGPQWLVYLQAAVWPGSVLLYDFGLEAIVFRPRLTPVAMLLNPLLYLSAAAALQPALREWRTLFAVISLTLSVHWWALL